MEIRNGNSLVIRDSDQVGYYDTMRTLMIGSIVKVEGKKYRIVEFSMLELAFGGNRVFFKVKEV
jgi:tyrosine-protein phosphatase YwqE